MQSKTGALFFLAMNMMIAALGQLQSLYKSQLELLNKYQRQLLYEYLFCLPEAGPS